MEQEDYLLREIEKIGMLLRAIAGRLANPQETLSAEKQNPFEQAEELLVKDLDFHLDEFLPLDEPNLRLYLSKFHGLNSANTELLAEILFQFGTSGQPGNERICLEKSLQLYELCCTTDKTYSAPRESRIREIKCMLASNPY